MVHHFNVPHTDPLTCHLMPYGGDTQSRNLRKQIWLTQLPSDENFEHNTRYPASARTANVPKYRKTKAHYFVFTFFRIIRLICNKNTVIIQSSGRKSMDKISVIFQHDVN